MEKTSCEDEWQNPGAVISQPSSVDKEVNEITGCTKPWGKAKSEWSLRGRLRKPGKPLAGYKNLEHGHVSQKQKGRPRQHITAQRHPSESSSSPRAVAIWGAKPLSKDTVLCVSTLSVSMAKD